MSKQEFVETQGDLFGRYCTIEMKRYGVENEFYRHKVIGSLGSNTWVEVPIKSPATETMHNHVEEVINVIRCGVSEVKVYRVRLKDVELLKEQL